MIIPNFATKMKLFSDEKKEFILPHNTMQPTTVFRKLNRLFNYPVIFNLNKKKIKVAADLCFSSFDGIAGKCPFIKFAHLVEMMKVLIYQH
jgi:hypothetical protein